MLIIVSFLYFFFPTQNTAAVAAVARKKVPRLPITSSVRSISFVVGVSPSMYSYIRTFSCTKTDERIKRETVTYISMKIDEQWKADPQQKSRVRTGEEKGRYTTPVTMAGPEDRRGCSHIFFF